MWFRQKTNNYKRVHHKTTTHATDTEASTIGFFDKYQFLHPSGISRRLSAAKMNIIYGAIFEEEVEVVDVSDAAGEATTTLLSNLTTYVVVST